MQTDGRKERMFRCSATAVAPLKASKWNHIQLLIDAEEMTSLLSALQPLHIFSCMGARPIGENVLTHEAFVAAWRQYIAFLQSGEMDEKQLRFYQTVIMTEALDAVVALDIGNGKEIISAVAPVVQGQMHRFAYSSVDKQFRSMVFGPQTISWGMQFSYPQLFEDPHTGEIGKGSASANFVLFRKIQQWVRYNTVPTPFLSVRVPMRLGNRCFSWINTHKDLVKQGLNIRHEC